MQIVQSEIISGNGGAITCIKEVEEEHTNFSSYVSCYINLCWTNWPCWGDNVTAGVSVERAKINLK